MRQNLGPEPRECRKRSDCYAVRAIEKMPMGYG